MNWIQTDSPQEKLPSKNPAFLGLTIWKSNVKQNKLALGWR